MVLGVPSLDPSLYVSATPQNQHWISNVGFGMLWIIISKLRKCTFLGLHVRHVRCFWVYSNILALSLSLSWLYSCTKDHSLDSLTPRIPCPASRHLSVLNHEFVLPGVVPAQNWGAGRMTCNLTHLTNPWLGWPKCRVTQLSKPPPCHPGLSSRSRTLLPISKSSPLSW